MDIIAASALGQLFVMETDLEGGKALLLYGTFSMNFQDLNLIDCFMTRSLWSNITAGKH